MPGMGSGNPDVVVSERLPSSATFVVLSGADSAAPASLVKEEVKREPDMPEDAPPATGTQSGAGDVCPGLEGTLLDKLQGFMANKIRLNTAEVSLSISKVENNLVKNMANINDKLNNNSEKLDGFQD